ncbi:hypothetical protein [Pantoea cypripedii]|uniref:Uncharacterized protein n=1 Tax=Pantoea cypripedii TaxID=55209 RepID=A0A6B9G5D7_PANCY|nr:hypothetical protein [Pantoea cypripedii]QGY32278.1 hypothetical protein CUN67_25130 [Pantoea cypripedii]
MQTTSVPATSIRALLQSAPATSTFTGQLATQIQSVKQNPQNLSSFRRGRKARPATSDNPCLNALKSDFATWWQKIPDKISLGSRLETLLWQFKPEDIKNIKTNDFHNLLLEKNIVVSATTVENALKTANASISLEDRQKIKKLWEQNKDEPDRIVRLRPLLRLKLSRNQIRRALLEMPDNPVNIDITTLKQAIWTSDSIASAEEVAWAEKVIEQNPPGKNMIAWLVDIQRRPDYQEQGSGRLHCALADAGISVKVQTVTQAKTLFRTRTTEAQQAWFSKNWPAISAHKISMRKKVDRLLKRQGRPEMTTSQLWCLFHNAKRSISYSVAYKALATTSGSQPTPQQKKIVKQLWHKIDPDTRMSRLKRLGKLLREPAVSTFSPLLIQYVLNDPHYIITNVMTEYAQAALNADISSADLAWIKRMRPRINLKAKRSEQLRQIEALLNHEQCPQNITLSKLLRLLWEIDEDVTPGMIMAALKNTKNQSAGDTPKTFFQPLPDRKARAIQALPDAMDTDEDPVSAYFLPNPPALPAPEIAPALNNQPPLPPFATLKKWRF